MSDTQNTAIDPLVSDPPVMPTSPAGGGSDDKSPLDALEQILKDVKAKGGGADDKKKAEEEAAEKERQEEEKKQQELARMNEEQTAEDQQKIAEQIKNLQNVIQTPEEQARQTQSQEKKEIDKQKQGDMDKNAIYQLGHTKI